MSSSLFLNLPLSLAVVLFVHAGAKKVDITWQNQRLSLSWRTEPTAFKAAHARPRSAATVAPPLVASAGRSAAAQARAKQHLDWKQLVDAPEVAEEVEALLGLVVRDVRDADEPVAPRVAQRRACGLGESIVRPFFLAVHRGPLVEPAHAGQGVPVRGSQGPVPHDWGALRSGEELEPRRARYPRHDRDFHGADGALQTRLQEVWESLSRGARLGGTARLALFSHPSALQLPTCLGAPPRREAPPRSLLAPRSPSLPRPSIERNTLARMTEENKDRAMVYEMLADGDLHGAVASPEAEHRVRRPASPEPPPERPPLLA